MKIELADIFLEGEGAYEFRIETNGTQFRVRHRRKRVACSPLRILSRYTRWYSAERTSKKFKYAYSALELFSDAQYVVDYMKVQLSSQYEKWRKESTERKARWTPTTGDVLSDELQERFK